MNPHRYTLQPYQGTGSRFRCPQCQHHNKTFKRYIDLQTNAHVADHVGRCDREDKCGYHYTPRQYFAQNPNQVPQPHAKACRVPPVSNRFNHLPVSLLRDSLVQKAYIHNNFILFLAAIFGWENALQAAERYNIGTSKHWHGATVFWQVDARGRVRTGKIMLYDSTTGKRVKQPFNHIAWVHKLVGSLQNAVGSGGLRVGGSGSGSSGLAVSNLQVATANSALKSTAKCQPPTANCAPPTANCAPRTANCPLPTATFNLRQCFFGEHLLQGNPRAMVGITESEKTAVMASIMMPDLVWLAAGSLHGLSAEKWQALKNRTVLLFPDVGAYDYWVQCARTLTLKIPTATFAISDDMETTATPKERATGADMGDRWAAEWLEMTQ